MIMKNKYIVLLLLTIAANLFNGCKEDEWLQREPKDMLTDDQVWKDPVLIQALIANYYDRLPSLSGVFNSTVSSEYDDAMWSGHVDQNGRNDFAFPDSYGRYWDPQQSNNYPNSSYVFIRDINLTLEKMAQLSGNLSEAKKKQFNAELRFIRAFVYFELVKRMGGVPLVTEQLIYDYSGNATPLQIARAKESEVYDFIYDEIEAIKENFVETGASKTRANKFIALALQSRAMLYAGSLAKYNNLLTAPITTPGGEVGIPADKATDYYQKSLAASEAILASPNYALYNSAGLPKGENFYKLFMDEGTGNKEVIFAKDFATGKVHGFTYDNVVRSFRSDIEGSSMISPSLNLVESYEYLDGTRGTLRDKDANGNYMVYNSIADIFANKDGRLYGTVVYPGSAFRSQPVDIQAGVAEWVNGAYTLRVGNLGSVFGNGVTSGDGKKLTGFDGPRDNDQYVSNTGFYLRKYVSENAQDGVRPSLASNWWVWFRLGEIYLNAAEAAFELGRPEARNYINRLREVHGGFPANSVATLTNDIIRNERRIELAFEDHRYFDLKRWRIAHLVWNGSETDPNAVVGGLYPYRVYRPNHADHNKYIFVRIRPTRFRRARFFQMSNYYSSIDPQVINNNPKIVRNPFH